MIPTPADAPRPNTGPKILTVDDSKTIRMIISRAFKPFACQIFEAADGLEGLSVVNREKPDIILLDFTMPVMDGLEMLTKLKSTPEFQSIPVVMLTAESGRENVIRIAKLGVRDYLIKPFKEEQIVERVGRIVDLKTKSDAPAKVKRYDEPLNILVVDDKPAIIEQVQQGLSDTAWKVHGLSQAGQAMDYCSQMLPDLLLLSLSLPDNAAFMLFQLFRSNHRTKSIPILALSVKTAVDEQARAHQIGLNGIITKPIDMSELKNKITRVLNLDVSYKYFQMCDGYLLINLPADFSSVSANEVLVYLRGKVHQAVDSGFSRLVVDLSNLRSADVNLIKLGLTIIQVCRELDIKYSLIGSEAVCRECKNYEETKDWLFFNSRQEALAHFDAKTSVNF